jgi:hypothetical protein
MSSQYDRTEEKAKNAVVRKLGTNVPVALFGQYVPNGIIVG